MNEFSGASGQTRRTVLKGAVGLAALGLGAGGALTSAHAAADAKAWPEKAFSAKGEAEALKIEIERLARETELAEQQK